jgi:alpha-L-fucosidase
VLSSYWYSFTSDYENSAARPTDVDSLLLRLSRNAGVDIRPLFHFWGVPPVNTTTLATAIAAANLHASPAIYDTLVHYKSLVPTNHAAFQAFALNWWGKQPSTNGYSEEREHAAQWEEFNEETAARIKKTVQKIIDTYFPDGRPPATKTSLKEMQADFLKLKFGMFICFNLETFKGVQWVAGYHSAADFNPGGTVDTDAWADAAVSAGMKYAVLTVKHVSGFCLWDSKYTTYDVMNTDCPYKQDLVAQFIKSFKSRGLKVGLYYCWRHPGFGAEFKVLPPECDPAKHSLAEQIEFQKKQMAELIEKYPDVFYIWNDGLDPDIMTAAEANAFFRGFDRDILASSNWWDWGKKGTPYAGIAVKEMQQFPENNAAPGETCWCLEKSWFWSEGTRPKTAKQVLDLMATVNSRNSNFLLNVGPNKQGKFEESSVKVLAEIGKLRNPNATADPAK